MLSLQTHEITIVFLDIKRKSINIKMLLVKQYQTAFNLIMK